jgi:hypothetical protein
MPRKLELLPPVDTDSYRPVATDLEFSQIIECKRGASKMSCEVLSESAPGKSGDSVVKRVVGSDFRGEYDYAGCGNHCLTRASNDTIEFLPDHDSTLACDKTTRDGKSVLSCFGFED